MFKTELHLDCEIIQGKAIAILIHQFVSYIYDIKSSLQMQVTEVTQLYFKKSPSSRNQNIDGFGCPIIY